MKSTGNTKKDAYVLSLKDMCGIKDLRGLADAGVYSLKIEGRMKQIPYAAGVVSYYRKYIDLFFIGTGDTGFGRRLPGSACAGKPLWIYRRILPQAQWF